MQPTEVLICTVGTGNIDEIEKSLLVPLRKSIRAGNWKQIILLPSMLTVEHARRLQVDPVDHIDVRPLPGPGLEDDADRCFEHFDGVINSLISSGITVASIVADFTRGTKAMSAALVLAAMRHGISRLRYVSGSKRDERGMVVAGTEVIKDLNASIVTAWRKIDTALNFMSRGDFAAVISLLSDQQRVDELQWPALAARQREIILKLARFYAAWDRLDYAHASGLCTAHDGQVPMPLKPFLVSDHVRKWVEELASQLPKDARSRATRLRALAVDLLANGERRRRDGQLEDAMIRAYRVLELIGQFRLADKGYHSDDLPADDPVIKAFQQHLAKNGSQTLQNYAGRLVAAREHAARFLKFLGDSLAPKLLKLGSSGPLRASLRNYSLLIHGFEAAAANDPAPLRMLYDELERLLILDSPAAKTQLTTARTLNFGLS
jgi:CRISPR-associated protein (TIGR02710 family)